MRMMTEYARLGVFIAVLWGVYEPFGYGPLIAAEIRVGDGAEGRVELLALVARHDDGTGEAETPRYTFRSRATWG